MTRNVSAAFILLHTLILITTGVAIHDLIISSSSGSDVIEVIENHPLNLTCVANNRHPPATISWFKQATDGYQEQLFNAVDTSNFHLNHFNVTSMLTLIPNRFDDGARVFCSASSSSGKKSTIISRKLQLSVLYSPPGDPIISGFSSQRPFYEGDLVTVTSNWSGGNPRGQVKLLCPDGSAVTGVSVVSKNITVTKLMHNKRCRSEGKHIFKNVVVLSPEPLTVSYASNVTMKAVIHNNGSVSLFCNIAKPGNPANHKIKPFIHVMNKTFVRTLAVENYTNDKWYAQIHNTTYKDSGYYECIVENGDFLTGRTFLAKKKSNVFTKQWKPVFGVQLSTFNATEGEGVVFKTSFFSFPLYTSVTWRKDGELVKIGRFPQFTTESTVTLDIYGTYVELKGYQSHMIADEIFFNSFGKYEINASNPKGWSLKFIHLKNKTIVEKKADTSDTVSFEIAIYTFIAGVFFPLIVGAIIWYICIKRYSEEYDVEEGEADVDKQPSRESVLGETG